MKNIMATLREKLSTGSLKLLTAPYLPDGLIWAALLLAYTDSMIVLIGQPAGYWIDRMRAVSQVPVLQNILAAGSWAYILTALAYFAFLWLCLIIFTRSVALILWLCVSFVHLHHSLAWAVNASHVFQGETANVMAELMIVAISALVSGVILVKLLLPRATSNEHSRLRSRLQPMAFWGWVVGLAGFVLLLAIVPRGGWMQLHPKHTPGKRAVSAVTYDSARHRIVLFGGISEWIGSSFYHERDTWEWDGKDWIEMKPKNSPPARAGHMMAYDEKNGIVVLFGGEDQSGTFMLSDTWTWDGEDWTQMSPEFYPSSRRGGQMFYDPETQKIILTGGFYYATGKVFTPISDTWAWDGKNWEYVSNLPANLMITNPNVAYLPSLKYPILYDYKRLLQWTNSQWQVLEVGSMPTNRFGPWLVSDPTMERMLIFGGIENNIQQNDTWLFADGAWKELHPDLTPAPRDAHVMFYDPARKSFIVYGGISTYALDDMWEYVLP